MHQDRNLISLNSWYLLNFSSYRHFIIFDFSFFAHSFYTKGGILTKLAKNIRYEMENPKKEKKTGVSLAVFEIYRFFLIFRPRKLVYGG